MLKIYYSLILKLSIVSFKNEYKLLFLCINSWKNSSLPRVSQGTSPYQSDQHLPHHVAGATDDHPGLCPGLLLLPHQVPVLVRRKIINDRRF